MKYYGERTNRLYDTEKECMEAEFQAKEKENMEKIRKEREVALAKEKKEKEVAERKAMAEEVESARKALVAAQTQYREALNKFCSKWGAYHFTLKDGEELPSIFNVFENFFRW